jgi:hypothetical protein
LTVQLVWPLLPSVSDRLPLTPSVTDPKAKLDALTVILHAVAGSRPAPVSGTCRKDAAGSLLLTLRVPLAAPATVGAKTTGIVIEVVGATVAGRFGALPPKAKAAPLIVSPLTEHAAVPVF